MFSVSYTTRAPRGNEVEGGELSFHLARRSSKERVAQDEFLEYAEVFGNYYGTHRGALEQARRPGKDLVLDIDVQGAGQLKSKIPDAVTIFILAPPGEILEQRLRARSEDSDAVIERRLRDAAAEIRNYSVYDYVLVNNELATSAPKRWPRLCAPSGSAGSGSKSRSGRFWRRLRRLYKRNFKSWVTRTPRNNAHCSIPGRSGAEHVPVHHRGRQARPAAAGRRASGAADVVQEADRHRHGRSPPRPGEVRDSPARKCVEEQPAPETVL